MLVEARCITVQVMRAILFKDSPCCGGPQGAAAARDSKPQSEVIRTIMSSDSQYMLHEQRTHLAEGAAAAGAAEFGRWEAGRRVEGGVGAAGQRAEDATASDNLRGEGCGGGGWDTWSEVGEGRA